jgi:hypothetical protein
MPDLFETPELLPVAVRAVVDAYCDGSGMTYTECKELQNVLHKMGYDCDYGLDAEPHSLRKIEGQEGSLFAAYSLTESDEKDILEAINIAFGELTSSQKELNNRLEIIYNKLSKN